MNRKSGLGKGLGALLGDVEEESVIAADENVATTELDISLLDANDLQPRRAFDDEAMNALVNSIIQYGVITPLIVTPKSDGRFLIIAGERRFRASKRAGLKRVPVCIRECDRREIDELSLIENLQREDLNPIEVAEAIKLLMQNYRYTQEEVADRVGRSRSAVANDLRLLSLAPDVKKLVASGELSSGHARCLAVVKNEYTQKVLAERAITQNLSAREFEKLVKKTMTPQEEKPKATEQSEELRDLATRLQRVFATKVSILGNDKKGRIFIDYYTRDDLDRTVELTEKLEKLLGL